MTLSEALAALSPELAAHATWRAVIVTREGAGEKKEVDYPIFDVSVDDLDKEIDLITDFGAPVPRPTDLALTVREVVERLRSLSPRCDDFGLYSGSAFMPLGTGYEGRLDVPLIGLARNSETQVFGFLEGPQEQWESTT